jgi:ubiquinone/menaquinone biosynthesis C-methylase UbiE
MNPTAPAWASVRECHRGFWLCTLLHVQHGWQLEGTSAELYERFLVPTVTLPWARDLVERIGLQPGDRVLDIACGTGVVARLAASTVGDDGRVAAVDVNRGMLAVGRSLPSPAGGPIEWYEASADALPFPDGEFDVALCQLGLQFFSDRPAALRETGRVLAVGGRVGATVFTSLDRNPAAHALADVVDRHLGVGASSAKRSEHWLADPDELRELFSGAGFAGIRIETVTLDIRFASVDEWVGIQFAATPLAALLAELDPSEREQVVGAVSAEVGLALAAFVHADSFTFPQEVDVTFAHV